MNRATGTIRDLVVMRDDRLVVFDKPVGLLSVPGIGPEKRDSLAVRAAAAFPGARIVHRLDRDTSGVIVMALDAEAHRHLSLQFQNRQVRKRYIAIVDGRVDGEAGTIDLPMRKDLDAPPRHVIDRALGRPSRTDWCVIDRGPDRTRLELRPVTGRSHQLRLHLEAIGHPILGDDLYGTCETRRRAERLMLHAESLGFTHPQRATWIEVAAPCPF